jgi:sensor histidine kinase regulating citrate/malate metabolism
MIKDNSDYMKLREENHVLSMELMQYDGLNQRIALARQGRHDLRHHILAMETLLDSGDVPALRSYLAEIGEKYQVEGALTFCSNRTVNGILTYFAEIANAKEIEFNVRIGIPEDVPVAKTDLSVLFGNLLENAIEACQKQSSGPRKIIVRSQMSQNTLALTVDNTYETIPEKDRLGRFRSMKHSGVGIGTESVKNIVTRYNGVIEFETRGDLFCVSVMLYLP